MKIISPLLPLLLILTLTACGSKGPSNQMPEDFKGNRRFVECFGNSAGDSGLCFEFTLDIMNTDDNQQILYSIDGQQTLRRLVCDIEKRDGEYKGHFNSYHEDDIHYSVDYEKGNEVFTIIKKNNDYYIKNFQSPYDETLIKQEYLLTPSE